MNFNTVSSYIGGTGRNQIASQTLAATTETELRVNTDNGTGAIAILTIPSGSGIGGSSSPQGVERNLASPYQTGRLGVPRNTAQPSHNSSSFDVGRPFGIRVAGVVTPASNAGNTFTMIIYCGTSKSGTAICTTGATTGMESSTQAGSFIMETQLLWDSTSQILNGQFWWLINAGGTKSYHVWAQNSAPATSIALAGLNFCVSVTWGNAAGGVVAASEFSFSQL